jgi:GFO/IDH/MocA oxidoreductase family protein
MKRITRRSFLKHSSAGVAALAAGAPMAVRALGASDRVRVAVMGIHGRGRDHVAELLKVDGVEVAALIDPDSRTFSSQVAAVTAKGGAPPRTEKDLRRVLDDRSIDALTIAAPNHWHALATIWGCQAGKDVYVEKPASHNVRADRRRDRLGQVREAPHRPLPLLQPA